MYTQWTCHGCSGQNTLQIGADGESRLDPSVVYLLATTTTWQASTDADTSWNFPQACHHLTWACPDLAWACPHLTWACPELDREGSGDAGHGSLHEGCVHAVWCERDFEQLAEIAASYKADWEPEAASGRRALEVFWRCPAALWGPSTANSSQVS